MERLCRRVRGEGGGVTNDLQSQHTTRVGFWGKKKQIIGWRRRNDQQAQDILGAMINVELSKKSSGRVESVGRKVCVRVKSLES